ncbi:LysR family transcriptional regulator [Novosphingobium sp.]|uniref:LysR family transcriptional regulator n=1 Tax=Novosphingobium sp. TaxID=1874826 RepID=UPI00262871EC|nr:LysR family transcriptional regulator [Novosphingobium sp.]
MSRKSVNLNLLPVLRELLRLRSISGAARALGRSPPAISEGLAQLRLTFNDPLLVRTAGRMELTPRALALINPVEEISGRLSELFEIDRFDPANARQMFTIAAHDFHVFLLGPALVSMLEEQAPGCSLRFVDLGHDLAEQLASRTVDLALMPDFLLGELAPARLLHCNLASERTVVLMREGHPLAHRAMLSHADLADCEHAAFLPPWESVQMRKTIGAFRRAFPARVRISQVSLLPLFIGSSDRVALAPEAVAVHAAATFGLIYRPVDWGERDIRSIAVWSPVQDSDAAQRWLRAGLLALVAKTAQN